MKKAGIHIYFVSCRGKKTKEADTLFNRFLRLKIVPFLTAMQLKRNFIKYNQLKIVENEDEKLEFIKKIHAQFVFDDQMSILHRLPEFSRAVCVSTAHNICQSDDRIFKVSSLADCHILETILKDYKTAICRKETPIKCFRRKYTDFFYILNRHLWKKLLVRKFRPIVYGAENIPNDKRAVIYVGNHRNNFDPVIATLYLKRPVHWCALLRLFEAKENLFGRDDIYFLRKLSSWFIKAIGALPIARPTDENYHRINLSTLLKADEYLKRGNSIGFFPEGTINRRPEEVDLLPVASDAVFQLAIRNSCWLQPFSIVWIPQPMGIHNKVIISYTEAIETTGMSAREVRSLWEQAVKCSIERANQAMSDSAGGCAAQVSDRQTGDADA